MKLSALILPSALMAISNFAAAATLYSLPFKGEDFSDSQKLFTADHANNVAQRHGYDISAVRYSTGEDKWLFTNGSTSNFNNNPTNAKSVIYNKPVYAMRSGTIVACWRNAPNNPRPRIGSDTNSGREWLHDSAKQGLMPGGGNLVWVEHDDGSMMLYAHMVPGSISADLCAKSASTFSRTISAGESEFDVAFTGLRLSDQVRVREGQLLGRVGNSGNSTGPHLHIHLETSGIGEEIEFKKGIAAKVDNTDQYGDWTSFAGKKIPSGATMIWPPRTVTEFYSRHALPNAAFQSLFDHLADSGYKPELLDGYSVGDGTFYNMIWKPSNVAWRAYAGNPGSRYQRNFTNAVNDGFVPVHVDSHTTPGGKHRFTAIFEKRNLRFLARHNLTRAQHDDVLAEARSLGLRPQSVSVVEFDGERRYTDLYTSESIGSWAMRSRIHEDDYQATYDSQKDAGRRPSYLSSYVLNGEIYYSAIFASRPTTSARATHGATGSRYQSLFNSYVSQGFKPVALTAINGHNRHRFAAVWRK